MSLIKYLVFAWISISAESWAINPTDQVNEISKLVTSEKAEKASQWILGHQDRIYENVQFWADLRLRHIIQISSTEIVPDRMMLATIVYSASAEVSIPSISIKNLVFGKEGEKWKIIPTEYLDLYLKGGSKLVQSEIDSKTGAFKDLPHDSFEVKLAAAVKQREEAEKATEEELIKQFKTRNLPMDRVLPSP
jgi:hypothetical protein